MLVRSSFAALVRRFGLPQAAPGRPSILDVRVCRTFGALRRPRGRGGVYHALAGSADCDVFAYNGKARRRRGMSELRVRCKCPVYTRN